MKKDAKIKEAKVGAKESIAVPYIEADLVVNNGVTFIPVTQIHDYLKKNGKVFGVPGFRALKIWSLDGKIGAYQYLGRKAYTDLSMINKVFEVKVSK